MARCVLRAGRIVLLSSMLAGCQLLPPLPPADFSEPGWQVREGQAIWRSSAEAPELAGELLFATNMAGRTMVQFIKTPIPFLTAQTTTNAWKIDFTVENRSYRGPGTPPSRLLWLHLARALAGTPPPAPIQFHRDGPDSWVIDNPRSGERISGVLAR
jgi:hypothetical protein